MSITRGRTKPNEAQRRGLRAAFRPRQQVQASGESWWLEEPYRSNRAAFTAEAARRFPESVTKADVGPATRGWGDTGNAA